MKKINGKAILFFIIIFYTVKNGVFASINRRFANVHVPFIENSGQMDENVKYYAETFGGTVFVTRDGEIVYALKGIALKETFVGGKIKEISGEGGSVTRVNYFRGREQSKWKSDIPAYDLVNMGEAYDGINLKLKAYGNNVEKLFYVSRDADPSDIRARIEGAKGISICENGELEILTELGKIRFTRPVAYQNIGGKRVDVEVNYRIIDDSLSPAYGFLIGKYDKNNELIIDPLLSSTFLGGSDNDEAYFLAFDSTGNLFVAGHTYSSDFPVTPGAYDTSLYGISDIFISKFNGELTTLQSSIFLGGCSNDEAYSIAFDSAGNVFLTGCTYSSDFPVTPGVYDTSFNSTDIFVIKLDNALSTLQASTLLGGSNSDYGISIALDTSDDVFITGYTESSDFPVTPGAYDTSFNGFSDVFVSKLDKNLTTLQGSTLLGGASYECARCIALDSAGDIFITGDTESADYSVTPGAYDTSLGGISDVFISKFDNGLTNLQISTFFGGSGYDYAYSLNFDTAGNIFLAGITESSDFPVSPGAYDTSLNGTSDVFVSKFNGSLTNLQGSTFLGGNSYDYARSLALDYTGNVFITGYTGSIDFPVTPGAYDTGYNGLSDIFVSKFNDSLTNLQRSTFLGGTSYDYARSIALDTAGNVFFTGDTESSDFPVTNTAFDTSFNGGVEKSDSFISRLDSNLSANNQLPSVSLSASPPDGPSPLEVLLTAEASDPDGTIINYEWDFDGDGSYDTATTDCTVSYTYSTTFIFDMFYPKVRVTDNDTAAAENSTMVFVYGGIFNAPTLNRPVNAERLTDTRPALTVNNTNYLLWDSLNYFYVVYSDSSLTEIFDSSAPVPGTNTDLTKSWTLTKDCAYGSKYWWRCRNSFDYGAGDIKSGWMDAASFIIGELDTAGPGINFVDSSLTVSNGNVSNNDISILFTDDSGLGDITVYLKRNGDPYNFDTFNISAYGTTFTFDTTISEGKVTKRGIHYKIVARDKNRNKSEVSGYFKTKVDGYSIDFPAWTWKMVSFPLKLDNNGIDSAVGPMENRRIYRWDPVKKEYSKTYDTSFDPGDAFWFKIKEDDAPDPCPVKVNGVSADPGNAPVITLPPGWSQIACPYAYEISGSKIKIKLDTTEISINDTANLWLENQFLTYDVDTAAGFQSYISLTDIKPDIGFWVKNRSDSSITVIFPELDASASGFMPSPSLRAKNDGWGLKLKVTSKNHIDNDNFIGFLNNAKEGYDINDLSEPPPVDNYVSLYFPHSDWGKDNGRYRTDYRSFGDYGVMEITNYDFMVESNMKEKAVITWEYFNTPVNCRVTLYDKGENKKAELSGLNDYTITWRNGESSREFCLTVEWDNIPLPDSLELSDFNSNHVIDGEDLFLFGRTFGKSQDESGWDRKTDLNRDKIIDGSDLFILGNNFGKNY